MAARGHNPLRYYQQQLLASLDDNACYILYKLWLFFLKRESLSVAHVKKDKFSPEINDRVILADSFSVFKCGEKWKLFGYHDRKISGFSYS